ncbi:MAG: methyl-accepting chemotaxis protein [Desulfobacter sp.]|nr:MAG: methyl-accepting chemotaxis protein [Desulfobacter sp.]
MKMLGLKLKQKILSVMLLVVCMVMVVSSLVIAYVSYNQNVDATNANLLVGANNLKSKIFEIQDDLIRKTVQMDSLFKVSENVKFIGEYKTDYDLSMTESGFVDLANALFATATVNNISTMAIYDAAGELLVFSEQQADKKRLAGYYYVNPQKAFKYTRVTDDADLKKSQWETQSSLEGLLTPVNQAGATALSASASLRQMDGGLALSIYVPVMVDDYNKQTDKMEPKRVGSVLLSKQLDSGFVSQMAELTGLHVNIFSGDTLSFGDLPGYVKISEQDLPRTGGRDWNLKDQPVLTGIVENGENTYFQGLLPIYEETKLAGAFSVLTSSKTAMDNAFQVVYTLVVVYLCCMVLIIPVALFFSGSMVKSLLNVTASLKDVAQGEGDLTKRIEIRSKDEIGELSQWFNLFIEKLQTMICDISSSSQALSQSVQVTRKEAADISDNSGKLAEITHSVTQSTNEMSSEISSISQVVGQASDNLDIVASSTEEMTATINEIAKNAETARVMSVETGEKIG